MSTSSLPASSKPMPVKSLDDLLALALDQLPGIDIAQMNLLCAEGLPGAAGLNIDKCLATLDEWATWVGHETDRHLYRFRCAPADYGHSEGYFRMLMLVTVLQQDFRVRYNPDRIGGIDFRDSRDLFIHGLLEGPHTGTCASMPVLYAAAGRRLGYPLRLVLTHGHVFVRWDSPDGRERFNIECASRGMLSFPDEYYKTWPTPLMEGQVRKGRYLRSLGAAEELAVFVASRGHCLLDNGQTRAARIAYEQACRLEPLSPGHWCWLQKAVHRESRELPPTAESPWHSAKECPGVHPPWPGLVDCSAVEPARGSSLNATRYRNFHPTLGRWIERDPAGYIDGMSLYEYVSSNPAGLTDPMGLCPGAGTTAPTLNLSYGDAQGAGGTDYRPAFDTTDLFLRPSGGDEGPGGAESQGASGGPRPTFWGMLGYEVTHPLTTIGLGLKTLAGFATFDKDRIVRAGEDLAFAAGTNYSSGNEYLMGVKARAQGVLNTVNGLQDAVIGLANLPALAVNAAAWAAGSDLRLSYTESPDWSEDLACTEYGGHGASKFIGGQSAFTLLTLGLSQLGAAGEAARLGHVTSSAKALEITTAEVPTLRAPGGIFALSNPSTSSTANAARAIVGLARHAEETVPITGQAAAAFRPVAVTGPLTALLRLNGAYFAETTSLTLGTGARGAVPSLWRTAAMPVTDMALHSVYQGASQDITQHNMKTVRGAVDLYLKW